MTCIAAVTDGTTVWMGADSQSGIRSRKFRLKDEQKIVHKQDASGRTYLIGASGNGRTGQIIRYGFDIGSFNPKSDDPTAFLANEFVPELQSLLKNKGQLRRDKDEEVGFACHLLIGTEGRLFWIDNSFAVIETDRDFQAIGSGADFALGALEALHGTRGSTDLLRRALGIAAQHDLHTSDPFTILRT